MSLASRQDSYIFPVELVALKDLPVMYFYHLTSRLLGLNLKFEKSIKKKKRKMIQTSMENNINMLLKFVLCF